MNSHRRRAVIYSLAALLLAGTIAAVELRPDGGGRNGGHRAHPPADAPPMATPGRTVARTTARTSPPALQPAPPRTRASSPDQPISTTGAVRAVAGFVRGFLAWSLGRGAAGAIPNATHRFIAQARAHPPNITPAERHERIRVTRIRVLAGRPPVAVVGLAESPGARFELDFYLVHRRGRWLVSAIATLG